MMLQLTMSVTWIRYRYISCLSSGGVQSACMRTPALGRSSAGAAGAAPTRAESQRWKKKRGQRDLRRWLPRLLCCSVAGAARLWTRRLMLGGEVRQKRGDRTRLLVSHSAARTPVCCWLDGCDVLQIVASPAPVSIRCTGRWLRLYVESHTLVQIVFTMERDMVPGS
jgi:hypothetical protein